MLGKRKELIQAQAETLHNNYYNSTQNHELLSSSKGLTTNSKKYHKKLHKKKVFNGSLQGVIQ